MTTDGPSLPQRDDLREAWSADAEKARMDKYGSSLDRWNVNHVAARIADYPELIDVVLDLLAARRDDLAEKHRDLVSRLGFGDDRTEPMADNDTIVAWFEERGLEAYEWRESQHWRDECYAAGHPDDEDCQEHDPNLIRDDLAERVARVEALADVATERAFARIAADKMLTIQPLPGGRAKVPPHWRDEAEARAMVPVTDLRAALTSDRAATEGGGDRG